MAMKERYSRLRELHQQVESHSRILANQDHYLRMGGMGGYFQNQPWLPSDLVDRIDILI